MAGTVLRTRLCAEKEIQPLLRFVIQVVSRIHPFFWQLLPVVCHYLPTHTIADNDCFADCLTQWWQALILAMMVLMQAKKSRAIEQPPIPQTMKVLPRFIFMIYPWYWIKRMYRSKHFRQFLVICMACALAVSAFLTIFLAYDNAQLRKEIDRKYYTLTQ